MLGSLHPSALKYLSVFLLDLRIKDCIPSASRKWRKRWNAALRNDGRKNTVVWVWMFLHVYIYYLNCECDRRIGIIHTQVFCISTHYNFIWHFPFYLFAVSFYYIQNILLSVSASGLIVPALFQVSTEMEAVVIMKILTWKQNTKCSNKKYTNINTK